MIIYIIMLATVFVVYATSTIVGSPAKMYDLLVEAANISPVVGNAEGSYLTMRSEGGGYIGLIFIGAGFAAAVNSQLYVWDTVRPFAYSSRVNHSLEPFANILPAFRKQLPQILQRHFQAICLVACAGSPFPLCLLLHLACQLELWNICQFGQRTQKK